MSDDGKSAVVLIALLGNVFSPRWARARANGDTTRSLEFSAINVAVHGPSRTRWAMTERSSASILRAPDDLAIGATELHWDREGTLVAHVDERTAPWGQALRGTIRFTPTVRTGAQVDLDGRGRHLWFPHAPRGRIEVDFQEPALSFRGHGYFDANAGEEPLEEAFRSWHWSRVSTDDSIALAYDVTLRDGTETGRGVKVLPSGDTLPLLTGAPRPLGATTFGLARHVRAEPGAPVRLVRTLENGPFYARTLVETTLDGTRAVGMHETVSLDRFASSWVRFLLPFRMRVEGT